MEKEIVRKYKLSDLGGILPKPDSTLTIEEINDVAKEIAAKKDE